MKPSETARVVIDTSAVSWEPGGAPGLSRQPLHDAADTGERVALERLAPGTRLPGADCSGGEEIFLLSGSLQDEYGNYGAGDWIRNPAGFRRSLQSQDGATYWVKRGHLRPMP